MATVHAKWWGVEVRLSHSEACSLTKAVDVSATAAKIVGGKWGVVVALIAYVHKAYLSHLNSRSGSKGITLRIGWTGFFYGAKRRGKGSSPCK